MKIRMTRREVMVGAAGAAGGLIGTRADAAVNRAEFYEVTENELELVGMDPAHDGLRIAQLSDVHVGGSTPDGRIISAVRRINELKPDLVILTGDYVTNRWDPVDRVPVVLNHLAAPTFAVLGNHDHQVDASGIRTGFERLGYTVLQNEHTVTRLRGAPLTILGVDDGASKHDDVAQTFKGSTAHGTRLVLTHLPNTADKLPENAGLATFTGHTHGGHVVIPGITDRIFRSVGRPYIRGLYSVRGNHLYVNRGLGFGRGGPAFRVGSEPELSVFTLRYREQAG